MPSQNKRSKTFIADFVKKAKITSLPPVVLQHLASSPIVESFAPGRINLLGEHVDYMGGKVLPAAVTAGCYVFGTLVPSSGSTQGGGRPIFLCSFDDTPFLVDPNDVSKGDGKNWRVFAKAAIAMVADEKGMSASAFIENCVGSRVFYIVGTLPIGSGMSSSAALSVALINVLRYVSSSPAARSAVSASGSWQQSPKEKVKLALSARRIEVEYCGLNCGIMDQFASVHGAAGHFLELDCGSLEYRTHPLLAALGDAYTLLLVNSMVKHDLGDSYNKIRNDMESAQKKIHAVLQQSSTPGTGGDFTFSAFVRQPGAFLQAASTSLLGPAAGADVRGFIEACKKILTPSEYLRASYVMEEMIRTDEFIAAVRPAPQKAAASVAATAQSIGRLLTATHRGLADKLGVSTEELELIHSIATTKCRGVLGGRVMGGGFGGCILMLLEKASLDETKRTIGAAFSSAFKINCEFIDADVGDGASVRLLTEKVIGSKL